MYISSTCMYFRRILDATSSVVKDASAECDCDFDLNKAPLELRTVVILPPVPVVPSSVSLPVLVNPSQKRIKLNISSKVRQFRHCESRAEDSKLCSCVVHASSKMFATVVLIVPQLAKGRNLIRDWS